MKLTSSVKYLFSASEFIVVVFFSKDNLNVCMSVLFSFTPMGELIYSKKFGSQKRACFVAVELLPFDTSLLTLKLNDY